MVQLIPDKKIHVDQNAAGYIWGQCSQLLAKVAPFLLTSREIGFAPKQKNLNKRASLVLFDQKHQTKTCPSVWLTVLLQASHLGTHFVPKKLSCLAPP